MFFGNVFGQFWKFRSFSFFKNFFQASTLQGAMAIFFRKKITSKQVQNMFGQYWDNFGHLRNIESFHFFRSFLFSSLQCALGKNFTGKFRNMFKTCLIAFRNVFWAKKLKVYPVFWIFPSFVLNWACFSEKLHTNKFNTCLDTFRNRKFRSFSFFQSFFQTSTLQGALAIFFLKEITWNMLGHYWEQFWTF